MHTRTHMNMQQRSGDQGAALATSDGSSWDEVGWFRRP